MPIMVITVQGTYQRGHMLGQSWSHVQAGKLRFGEVKTLAQSPSGKWKRLERETILIDLSLGQFSGCRPLLGQAHWLGGPLDRPRSCHTGLGQGGRPRFIRGASPGVCLALRCQAGGETRVVILGPCGFRPLVCCTRSILVLMDYILFLFICPYIYMSYIYMSDMSFTISSVNETSTHLFFILSLLLLLLSKR